MRVPPPGDATGASCGAVYCTADAEIGPHVHGNGVITPTADRGAAVVTSSSGGPGTIAEILDQRDDALARAGTAEAKVAAASRWANRFAEFLEDECDPCDAVCHGFDVTDDGRCSLAADLDNLRAIIRGEGT